MGSGVGAVVVPRARPQVSPRDATDRAGRVSPSMPHFIFLTGKLAEPSLRRMLAELAPRVGFEYTVGVLPITVAALATTPWIATHFTPVVPVDRIILPGLCNGELAVLTQAWGELPVAKGPADLRDLPEYF